MPYESGNLLEERKVKNKKETILISLKIRTCPVTAFRTLVGMIPIDSSRTPRLERFTLPAVIAVGGLIFGTFKTFFFVPVFVSLI